MKATAASPLQAEKRKSAANPSGLPEGKRLKTSGELLISLKR